MTLKVLGQNAFNDLPISIFDHSFTLCCTKFVNLLKLAKYDDLEFEFFIKGDEHYKI